MHIDLAKHTIKNDTWFVNRYTHTHYRWEYPIQNELIEVEENETQETTTQYYLIYQPIAAVSIRAEVTAQADYVILYSGKSELLVQIKPTEKDVTGT